MTIYVENETDFTFPFDTKELCSRVAEAVLDAEGCPYETEINVLITDNEGIRLYNKEYRNIDRETDVLSFPNIPFETEADFSIVEENCSDYFQPDSGEHHPVSGSDLFPGGKLRTFPETGVCIPRCAQHAAFVRLRSRNTGGSGCDGAEAGNYIKRARADPGLPG